MLRYGDAVAKLHICRIVKHNHYDALCSAMISIERVVFGILAANERGPGSAKMGSFLTGEKWLPYAL